MISNSVDVLYMIDRSASSDVDLINTKQLLLNLTNYFDVAYYKKIVSNCPLNLLSCFFLSY